MPSNPLGNPEDVTVACVSARAEGAKPSQQRGGDALHNGDPEPRFAVWTTKEPVTLLGAWMTATNQHELRELFGRLARSFANCSAHSYEVIATDVAGDMAYTVGYEHTTVEVNGELRTIVAPRDTAVPPRGRSVESDAPACRHHPYRGAWCRRRVTSKPQQTAPDSCSEPRAEMTSGTAYRIPGEPSHASQPRSPSAARRRTRRRTREP